MNPKNNSGCVGSWSFDEGSGTTAHDDSGNENHGSVIGATWVKGKVDGALSFDGVDDWVKVVDNATLRPAKVTACAWAKSAEENWNTYSWVVAQRVDTHDGGYAIHPYPGSRNIAFAVGMNGGWHGASCTPADITIWHHYAGTYDGTDVKIYVDGVLQQTVHVGGDITYDGKSDVVAIGSDDPDAYSGCYGHGMIDEVKIYNRALSAEEIKALARVRPLIVAMNPILFMRKI